MLAAPIRYKHKQFVEINKIKKWTLENLQIWSKKMCHHLTI